MFQSHPAPARLAGPPRQARRDALARADRPSRPRTPRHIASSRAGARLRRLGAVLAAVTAGLLASVVGIPAAFAGDIPPGLYGRFPGGPVVPATGHTATAGGIAGWQIALITAIALAAAAVVTALLGRAQAARRAAPSMDPDQPGTASSPGSASARPQSTVSA